MLFPTLRFQKLLSIFETNELYFINVNTCLRMCFAIFQWNTGEERRRIRYEENGKIKEEEKETGKQGKVGREIKKVVVRMGDVWKG